MVKGLDFFRVKLWPKHLKPEKRAWKAEDGGSGGGGRGRGRSLESTERSSSDDGWGTGASCRVVQELEADIRPGGT